MPAIPVKIVYRVTLLFILGFLELRDHLSCTVRGYGYGYGYGYGHGYGRLGTGDTGVIKSISRVYKGLQWWPTARDSG